MLTFISVKNIALGLLVFTNSVQAFGPAPVALGTAGTFAILAKSGVSTVPSSAITGNVGLSPAASPFLTGFAATKSLTGTSSTSIQVVGSLFAADYSSPTPSNLQTAVGNMQTAFANANGRVNATSLNLGAGLIGGLTLTPGLYKWTSAVLISTDVTIFGTALDTWIFQVAGQLTTASAVKVVLVGGALPRNIVWVVSGAVNVGTTSHFEGVILGGTDVTLKTGASMNGRILGQTAVTLQKATLVQPAF